MIPVKFWSVVEPVAVMFCTERIVVVAFVVVAFVATILVTVRRLSVSSKTKLVLS